MWRTVCVSVAAGVLLGLPFEVAPLGAQDSDPAHYLDFSGGMWSIGSFQVGLIEGTLYNRHPTKAVAVSEVMVSSSDGNRVFHVNYTVLPLRFLDVKLQTGLHLELRAAAVERGWWNLTVTRARWHAGARPGEAPR